jgi:hypothetical protein
MFKREHHQRLARVLGQLDAVKLRRLNCFFGGGTAIALRFGEWRESVDLDFLVSDLGCYRELRYQVTQANSLQPLQFADCPPFTEQSEPLVDQYGIRFRLLVDQQPIKFEIVHEGRMVFEAPTQSDQVLGVATLNLEDLVARKLLANSDRWNDDSVFSRDLLDLAVLPVSDQEWGRAVDKAECAYGLSIRRDLRRALQRMCEQPGWLERCQQMLAIQASSTELRQQLQRLERRLPPPASV